MSSYAEEFASDLMILGPGDEEPRSLVADEDRDVDRSGGDEQGLVDDRRADDPPLDVVNELKEIFPGEQVLASSPQRSSPLIPDAQATQEDQPRKSSKRVAEGSSEQSQACAKKCPRTKEAPDSSLGFGFYLSYRGDRPLGDNRESSLQLFLLLKRSPRGAPAKVTKVAKDELVGDEAVLMSKLFNTLNLIGEKYEGLLSPVSDDKLKKEVSKYKKKAKVERRTKELAAEKKVRQDLEA